MSVVYEPPGPCYSVVAAQRDQHTVLAQPLTRRVALGRSGDPVVKRGCHVKLHPGRDGGPNAAHLGKKCCAQQRDQERWALWLPGEGGSRSARPAPSLLSPSAPHSPPPRPPPRLLPLSLHTHPTLRRLIGQVKGTASPPGSPALSSLDTPILSPSSP